MRSGFRVALRPEGGCEPCVLHGPAAQSAGVARASHGDEFMTDFAEARQMMVEGQVHTYDVTDPRVLAAMLEVPREHFVPEDKQALAYADRDLPVTNAPGGRTPRYLLKPAVLARLIQGAEVLETDRVLDVGCASGYSSAVLAKLAGSSTRGGGWHAYSAAHPEGRRSTARHPGM